MAKSTCPTCGQPIQGDECVHCRAATAFAKPDDAKQAKVTPPAASDGAIREEEPPYHSASSIRHDAPHILMRMLPVFIVLGFLLLCAGLLIPATLKVRDAAARTHTTNNFKQIGMACLGYHDATKRLPTPLHVEHKDGIKLEVQLSWRLSIYPYVESNTIYGRFDRTVGWDHPNNVPFQTWMPVYSCPHRSQEEPPGHTCFQLFVGPNTPFPDNVPRTLKEIRDGSHRTFLFAEADQPVIWSRPADMAIRPDGPLPLPEDRFFATMADGTVRMFVRSMTSDAVLRQLINPNDQKPDPGWDN